MSEVRFPDANAAQVAFYRAFAGADLDAMMFVWADDDTIACIHPLATPLEGRDAVRRSWQSLFKNAPRLEFRLRPVQTYTQGDAVIHLLYEHLWIADTGTFRGSVITTNAYRRQDDGWRMVLHHASPLPREQASAMH